MGSTDISLFAQRPLLRLSLVALAGCYGAMTVSALPILVNAWVSYLGLSPDVAGLIASVNVLGVTVALIVSAFLIARFSLADIMAAGLAIAVASDVASAFASHAYALGVLRFTCGFGLGLTVAATTNWISRDAEAQRGFGIFVTLQFVFGALLLLLATLMESLLGYAGIYAALLTLALVAVGLLPVLRRLDGGAPLRQDASLQTPKAAIGGLRLLSLLGLMLFSTAAVGLWAYMLVYGVATGLSTEHATAILALSALCGIPGGILVLVVGTRIGRVAPILAALALFAAPLFVFTTQIVTPIMFIAGLVAQNIAWNFVYPYYQGVQGALDPSGRLPVWGVLCSSIGSALGPALFGATLHENAYQVVFVIAASILGASALAIAAPAFFADRAQASAETLSHAE